MGERASAAVLRDAVNHYARTLAAYGLMDSATAAEVTVAAPYGRVMYVCRYNRGTDGPRHDVPGFEGTGGAGFLTYRDGIERVRQSTRTVFELARVAGWHWTDPDTATV